MKHTTILLLCFLLISAFLTSCKKKENVTFAYTYPVTFTIQGNPTSIVNNEYLYDVCLTIDNTNFLNAYQDKGLNLQEVFISSASMNIVLPPTGTFDGFDRVVLAYGGEKFVIPPIEIGSVNNIPPVSLTTLAFEPIYTDLIQYARRPEIDMLFSFVSPNSTIPVPLTIQANVTIDATGKER